jgi:hypothetical protein
MQTSDQSNWLISNAFASLPLMNMFAAWKSPWQRVNGTAGSDKCCCKACHEARASDESMTRI